MTTKRWDQEGRNGARLVYKGEVILILKVGRSEAKVVKEWGSRTILQNIFE